MPWQRDGSLARRVVSRSPSSHYGLPLIHEITSRMTAKDVIVEILTRASSDGLPEQVGPSETLDRIAIYAELVDAGYLTGLVDLGQAGRPETVCGARITALGRQYLEQLTKERRDKRALPIAKRSALWCLRWVVLPVALALGIAWLIKHFALK